MSEKVRVHEIAKELGITSKEVVEKVVGIEGITVKTASSSVSMEEAERIMNYVMNGVPAEPTPKPKIIKKAKKAEETAVVTTETVEAAPAKEETKEATPVVEVTKEEVTATPVKEEVAKTTTTTTEATPIAEVKKEETTEATPEVAATPKKAPLIKEVQIPVKRSGLRIVKKRKPKVEEVISHARPDAGLDGISSYGKMSAAAQAEMAAGTGKRKRTNNNPARKHEGGKRLDIFGGMGDVSMDYESDEVVLLDLNAALDDKPAVAEEVRKPRPKKPAGRNGNKGGNGGGRKRQVSRGKRKKYIKDAQGEEIVTHVEIPEDIRVYEFAEELKRPISDVIKVLFNLGMMATKNDFLGKDEIEILSEEFEVEVTIIDPKDAFNYEEIYDEDDLEASEDGLVERPPVVTIMGHVDHGKTSLLDAIRDARVTASEAGGITQHIGAYTVVQHGKKITFMDTPGHAAFSAMRARGAEATDIIVIVVAADDGVKPQTLEAIKHAKDSGAPVIVALNKMDKETANPELVKGQMAEKEMTPTDWGGEIDFIPLSAKTGEGINDLLENILTQADLLELRANPDAKAKAVVVESSVEKGRGPVATVIVQNGTLRVGDNVVCGASHGRVKAIIDDHKKQIKEIGLSETAVVVGLNEVPAAGDTMISMDSDKEAKEFAQKRADYDRQKELSASTKTSLDELTALIAEGKLKTLKVVLKTDVHGSLEAIRTSLEELRNDEVKVQVISSGVGGITENDVELVNNSENCALLGFNVRPTGAVKASAKQKGVEIRTYSIIYQLLDDITAMLTGMMAPKFTENNTGQADVKQVFKIPGGLVAGCMVVDGKLERGGLVRVIREGVVIFEGALDSLKRFKDDVKEVGNGYECGVVIKGYDDVVEGDVIETFKKVEQKVEL